MNRTLGTQLRHLIELLDSAVEQSYRDAKLDYTPRFTPVMRLLIEHPSISINQIAEKAGITQPAATQTVKVMERKGLVKVVVSQSDARKREVSLSKAGKKMVPELQRCWQATEHASKVFQKALSYPLSDLVEEAIERLEKRSFSQDIQAAMRAPKKPK